MMERLELGEVAETHVDDDVESHATKCMTGHQHVRNRASLSSNIDSKPEASMASPPRDRSRSRYVQHVWSKATSDVVAGREVG